MRLLVILSLFLLPASAVDAAVEVALRGQQPVVLEDVYHQRGVSWVALDDLLKVVGLSGQWDSVAHTYRIRTSRGWVVLTPASGYMRIGDLFYPMQDRPIFIDGRLRVSDHFIQTQLAQLTERPVFFRNLQPDHTEVAQETGGGIDELFARLFRRPGPTRGPTIRAIAIDPGHGGLDTGVIAPNGYNEKLLTFEVAEKLARLLRMRMGIPVYVTRSADYDVSLDQRLETALREDVDLWLLLHAQSSFSDKIRGIDLFVREQEESVSPSVGSQILATQLAEAMIADKLPVRGVYTSPYLSLGRGNLPTVQLEIGYLSHPDELRLLRREDYQQRLVQAVFNGIQNYIALSRKTQ